MKKQKIVHYKYYMSNCFRAHTLREAIKLIKEEFNNNTVVLWTARDEIMLRVYDKKLYTFCCSDYVETSYKEISNHFNYIDKTVKTKAAYNKAIEKLLKSGYTIRGQQHNTTVLYKNLRPAYITLEE